MSLPDLIEIVPLDKPVRAEITVPGSKSITNRALILAALADGEVTLEGALWSEDTQIMVECLQELGFIVDVRPDPNEFCNRTITVYGKGGLVPPGGTEEQPLELFVGNAGTAARFLAAFVCLGKGVYRLHGIPRMNERPKASLFKALRELGYRVESPTNKLPALIYGTGPNPGANCTVEIKDSSQFASALLLCAQVGGWTIEVTGENAEESPYVAMTSKLIEAFPRRSGKFQIEPDASSGSYFWAAGVSTGKDIKSEIVAGSLAQNLKAAFKWTIGVNNWPTTGFQIDERFPFELFNFAASAESFGMPGELKMQQEYGGDWRRRIVVEDPHLQISRQDQLGDSIMTLIAIGPFNSSPVSFTDLGRLRVQECERVVALRTELTKCGAKVTEEGDTLTVYPSQLHGAEIETYNDHRMAMCFAILGLKVPGIKLKNPACVKKTFPNFFQKLAAEPPHGLGATILDGKTGRKLTHEELFAD